ncbi:MAG TPA: hypothetical protein VNN73_08035 [Blastocatellia bacterium]|nr:hypothetical protein [Blastocatellia bacterium]
MAKRDLEITKESSFPRRDYDVANVSENRSDLGDKSSGGPQPSRTKVPEQKSEENKRKRQRGRNEERE